ncbi:hypothetical protein AB0M80_01830 [Amycolatopsis sp. NPDC051045]|uniref:hypothetical protein n=1 Tax=Amycolatopsis sp. NPDC051045 TaxID=3156922 RepID=UPI0034287575
MVEVFELSADPAVAGHCIEEPSSWAGTPADPDGWFLQRRDRLTSSPTGVFCATAANRVTFERKDADDDLWRAVRLLGGRASRVWSGNCVFRPTGWVAWVTSGTLPPVERLRP